MRTKANIIKNGQNTSLNEVSSLDNNQYFLVNGENGTKKISVENFKDALINTTTLYDIDDNEITYLPKYLEPYVYYNQQDIYKVTTNATNISSNAFGNCSNLSSVDLSNATNIGYYAFYFCSSLSSVDLSNAISIGYYAFRFCGNLTSVYVNCEASAIGNNALMYTNSELTIHVHPDALSTYTSSALDRIGNDDATVVEWIQD